MWLLLLSVAVTVLLVEGLSFLYCKAKPFRRFGGRKEDNGVGNDGAGDQTKTKRLAMVLLLLCGLHLCDLPLFTVVAACFLCFNEGICW
jgi:hypothetical protein